MISRFHRHLGPSRRSASWKLVRLAALTTSAVLISGCMTSVSISRKHDLQPGDLRGTVAIHALGDTKRDPEFFRAMDNRFAQILGRAGLTPVPADKAADWHFEWAEITMSKPLLVANLRMRTRDGRVRWMGSCTESERTLSGIDDNSWIRSTRRIRLLMDPFPGENQVSERPGVRLVPTPDDARDLLLNLGTGLAGFAAGAGSAAGGH